MASDGNGQISQVGKHFANFIDEAFLLDKDQRNGQTK